MDAIAPGKNDTVLTKWRYSAFKRTKLRKFMQERGREWRRVRADLTFVKLAKEPTIATWWRLLSAAR